jgi:hypothetical protein
MLTLSINLGELSQICFSADRAQSYHQQALNLSREIGVRDLECEALRNLGMDYLLKLELSQAEEYLWESLDLADLYGAAQARSQIIENLAEVSLSAGKLEQAADLLEQLQESGPSGETGLGLGLQRLQARLVNLRKQPTMAIQIMLHLLSAAEQQPDQQHLLWQLYYELAQLYSQQREWLPYAGYIQHAYQLMQLVLKVLHGCDLETGFQNAVLVKKLSQEYYFVCGQEENPLEATIA